MLTNTIWQERHAQAVYISGQGMVSQNRVEVLSYPQNVEKKIKELNNRKKAELALKYPDMAWIARCDNIIETLKQDLIKYGKRR